MAAPSPFDASEEALTTQEGWRIAESLVQSLGPLSSMFTAAIRAVRSAGTILHTSSPEKIKKFSIEAINFPVKVSPTFKAAYFFFAEELDEDHLALAMPLTQQKLLSLFEPDELISVIAITYMFRLMKRRCDLEEWERLLPKLSVHMQIGLMAGERITGIGCGNGAFIASVRYFAQSIMLYADVKKFKELRRKVEAKNQLFDLAEEQSRFGCNHLQVASYLASALGYGVGPRLAFGMDTHAKVFGPLHAAIAESQAEIDAWRTAIACIESLHARGCSPDYIREGKNEYLATGAGQELEKKAIAAVAKGTGARWFLKGPEDLPPQVCAQLGIKVQGKKDGGEGAKEKDDLEE